jgi:hypothetical protein
LTIVAIVACAPPRQLPWPPGDRKSHLRDELLSIERLEERAMGLAAAGTVDTDPRRRA